MDLEHKNKGDYIPSDPSGSLESSQSSGFSKLSGPSQAYERLIFISSILEVVLSLGVIFASVAGFIQPVWFSAFLCTVASLTSIVGIVLLYKLSRTDYTAEQLVRDAMRRIMKAQN